MLVVRIFIALSLTLLLMAPAYAAGKVFYRYINSDGVKVMNHTLPVEYSQKGYEVVSLSGKVIDVVDAAPTAEEIAKLTLENRSRVEMEAWDKRLRRRYSRVNDIKAAKKRKLAGINTSISILKGNLHKLDAQLQVQQAQAAQAERKGHKVTDKLLTNITNLELEIKTTKDKVETRRVERQELSDKFDRDIERFKIIKQKKNR